MGSCREPWIALLLLPCVWAVGPSPTATTQMPLIRSKFLSLTHPESGLRQSEIRPIEHVDRLWEEIDGVKVMMSNIAGQLDKFNSLYLGKLEHRMLMTSTLLASVDSNIHGLQERSHAWDTFQLHVAAWNEQIKSLDSKVDLLSRGQEKMVVLDNKVSQLMALEYKLERMSGRLDETFHRVRQLEVPRDPLVGEFAARGALSTLKVIERKVDRLQAELASVNAAVRPKRRRNETEAESTGKLVIRCNTPPAIEEALQDVRAKVDLMYDRLAPETDSNELADEPDTAGETSSAENILLSKLRKRLATPQRKTTKTLKTIKGLVQGLNTTSGCQLHEESDRDFDEGDIRTLLGCCRDSSHRVTNLAENAEILLKRVEGVVNEVHGQAISNRESFESHFRRQTTHFQSLLDRIQTCSPHTEDKPPSPSPPLPNPPTVIPLASDYDGSGDATNDEGSGDDEDSPQGSSAHDAEPSLVNSGTTTSTRWKDNNEEQPDVTVRAAATTTTTTASPILDPWTSSTDRSLTTTSRITLQVRSTTERSCDALALANVERSSAVYELGSTKDLNAAGRDFYTRYCDLSTLGGGWTVIQRRGEQWSGQENFTRSWDDYSYGFGSLQGEFWFGNEYIHRLTYETDVTLRVELEDWDGQRTWAEYSTFRVDAESDEYRVWISGYEGNATDSFGAHDGTPFSTVDRDNDGAPPCCPCAPAYGGGWWFYSCFEANLNGDYYGENEQHESFRGIIWEHWRGDYSLKSTRMMVRPRSLSGDVSLDNPDQIYPDP